MQGLYARRRSILVGFETEHFLKAPPFSFLIYHPRSLLIGRRIGRTGHTPHTRKQEEEQPKASEAEP